MASLMWKVSRQRQRGGAVPALIFLSAVIGGGLTGFIAVPGAAVPRERSITIRARQYGYQPEVLRVNRGDTIRLRFIAEDVVHGFYLEGHGIDVTIIPLRSSVELRRPGHPGERELVEEVEFVAGHEGKFRYRCSQTCGFLHPFMLGELIVEPNRLLPTGVGLASGILVGGLLVALLRIQKRET